VGTEADEKPCKSNCELVTRGETSRVVGEVRRSELGVIFFDCEVVCSCSSALVGKTPERYGPSVDSGICVVKPGPATRGDTFILRRAGSITAFTTVAGVLRGGRRPDVGLSVVEAVVIDVIDKHRRRDSENVVVHRKESFFAVGGFGSAGGVECPAIWNRVPFVLDKDPVIIGIDDGVFASCQGYSAEGVAVAQQPVQENRGDKDRLQPAWKPQCDVDLDLSPPEGISNIKNQI